MATISTVIYQFGAGNISADRGKTKLRVTPLLEGASSNQRDDLLAMGNYLNFRSFNNVRIRGLLTGRMLLAICAVFKVDPAYLTGESDIDDGYNRSTVFAFIKRHNII